MVKSRVILHLDLDAFYASVEQRDRPELLGRPVIVGGAMERGVVSACSYEARTFGVHSAMSMARAVRLCPQAVVLPVRMARYRELSRQVFAIFARYTDLLEPLSIDEAFLDVTGSQRLFGDGSAIAGKIRREVRAETALTVSAGVAPNKFLAKLASEAGKPDGLVEVTAERLDDFLLPLPLSRLWGVGRVMAARLEKLGLRTVADLRQMERETLVRRFGSTGDQLYRLSRGEDERPVSSVDSVKSIGHEETFARDLRDGEELRRQLLDLAERVARRLRASGHTGRCLTLKVRYPDFVTVSRSLTLADGTDHAMTIFRKAEELLGRTEAGCRSVRLLGLSLSQLEPLEEGQQDLFGVGERHRLEALDRAVDRLYERFGGKGVRRGSLLPDRQEVDLERKPRF